METLEEELKKGPHTKDRKLDLIKQSNRAFEDWKSARKILMAKQETLIRAMEQRSYVEIKISILEENIEQQPDPKPDDEVRIQLEPRITPTLPEKSWRGQYWRVLPEMLLTYLLQIMILMWVL
ncbi:hypothetical protein BASA83_004853 [Batrachochytrium salamandrivorans]|nr:hypothetical protein BASA83_004853 [Batrachochytrium salamandrivorans]